jgi:hypothetical protein
MVESSQKEPQDYILSYIPNRYTKNIDSSMISPTKTWEQVISKDSELYSAIKEHGFEKPSKI